MKVDFGTRLKRILDEKEIKQKKMAKDLNISAATISGYATNAHQPNIDILMDMADYLQVPLEELIGYPINAADQNKKEKIKEIVELVSMMDSDDLELMIALLKRINNNEKKSSKHDE